MDPGVLAVPEKSKSKHKAADNDSDFPAPASGNKLSKPETSSFNRHQTATKTASTASQHGDMAIRPVEQDHHLPPYSEGKYGRHYKYARDLSG